MRKSLENLVGVFCGMLLLFTVATTSLSYGQCNLKIESKVEKSQSGSTSDISLKVGQASGTLNFYLIDLEKPQAGPVQQTQQFASALKNDFVVVFRDVPPSKYIIQAVDGNKCQISIGGIEGITISSN